ncbi:MAG: hypothetical protein GY913_30845 [Proteobacteria bacterium]|nr:hypothetical protein [Pseudomonadota bacterium]MCP4921315.1 hypothetical protein [Pseudomonadota bacterium]
MNGCQFLNGYQISVPNRWHTSCAPTAFQPAPRTGWIHGHDPPASARVHRDLVRTRQDRALPQVDSGLVEDTGDTGPDDTGDPPLADEDGHTVDEDCNDHDEDIHPGASETCDGVDEDCDGDIDEGSVPDTDDQDLGDITDEYETILTPWLFPDGGFSWFDVELWLYQVPNDADYMLDLYWIEDDDGEYRGWVASADEHGNGGFEVINHGGSTGTDDSGWYQLHVSSVSGSSCAQPYQLQFLIGSW